MFGGNKRKSKASLKKANSSIGGGTGYGGHFRAVQGFKYIGNR